MRKKVLISTLLSVSMILSSLSGFPQTVSAATGNTVSSSETASTQTSPAASELPPEKNDPGYERLSGAYEPAAEENITPNTGTGTASSNNKKGADPRKAADGFLTVNPAGSNLKGYASTVSSYTGNTYTHSSDHDGLNIYNGIDVSYHQGDINWESVKDDGIDFAILRLGYRGYSTGSLVTDSKFTAYIQDAISAGMPLGAYFWTEAVNVDEAIQEAQYVINLLAPYKSYITMPVVIDWELNSNSRRGNLSKETNTAVCSTFCDLVKQNGYTPMVYANISDLNNKLNGKMLSQKYEIWIARYNNIVNNDSQHFTGSYSMWQYSSAGTVNGISTNVDMNFLYNTGSPTKPAFAHAATASAINVDSLDDVEDLSARSYAKKLVLSWNAVEDADGYQIYRKDSYNGTYKKIKQITRGKTTSWTNSGLSKNHEYYYKVRAYHKNSDGTVYSDYTLITAATKSSSQTGITKKNFVLYKKPVKSSAKLMTVKKGMPLEYVGVTYRKDGSKFHHFRYYVSSKVYDGYSRTKSGLTYYTQGTTTTKLNLRKTAGTSGKLITSIPKNTALPLLGTKKVKKAVWYKVAFSTKKNTVTTGYVAGSYIKK